MAKESLQDKLMGGDLRRALAQATKKPINCAVALSPDKKEAVVLLDRKLKGKKLVKKIRAEGPDAVNFQSIRFGYASIEASDPKTVRFLTNKSFLGGTVPAALRIVRKAGFSDVVNIVDANIEDESEESTELADDNDEGEEDVVAAPATAEPATPLRPAEPEEPAAPLSPASPPATEPSPAAAAPEPVATTSEPEPAAPPPPVDLGKAAARLAALAKMAGPAAIAYPSRKAMLVELTNQAKAMLLAGEDPDEKLDAMEATLREIAKARAEGKPLPAAGAPQAQANGPADETVKAALVKADQVWRGASVQMRKDLETLKSAVLDAYADNQATQSAIRGSLREFDGMFSWIDGRLEGKIGEAMKAGSADERRSLARESAQIAADYLAAARSQTRIKDLDDNPFAVRTRFGDTIDKVLPNLEKLMQGAG